MTYLVDFGSVLDSKRTWDRCAFWQSGEIKIRMVPLNGSSGDEGLRPNRELTSQSVGIEVIRKFEVELSAIERSQVGRLFPQHWVASDGEVGSRGWVRNEPACRILILRDGNIVGNSSICEATSGLPRGLGIGDVVVAENERGNGLGRRLLVETDQFFKESGAEFAVAASRNSGVRKVLREIGYQTPLLGSLYFRRGDYWCWNETWLYRGQLHPSAPTELLSDF